MQATIAQQQMAMQQQQAQMAAMQQQQTMQQQQAQMAAMQQQQAQMAAMQRPASVSSGQVPVSLAPVPQPQYVWQDVEPAQYSYSPAHPQQASCGNAPDGKPLCRIMVQVPARPCRLHPLLPAAQPAGGGDGAGRRQLS